MKTLRKIDIGKYEFLGISDDGVLYVCYWDYDKDKLVWVPKDEVIDPTTGEVIDEYNSVLSMV